MPSAEPAVNAAPGWATRKLRQWLAEPRLAGVSVDSGEFVELHRSILLSKPIMRQVFAEFYQAILDADARWFRGPGARIELGAGSSVFDQMHPAVISTDVKMASTIRAVVDAQQMPFRPGAVRALYGINCFHHFPDPDAFFRELVGGLAPGAGCVLIEPYHGPLAAQFYRRLFATERFDRSQQGWASTAAGPMTGANQALSYIVFARDGAEFARRYPGLEVVEQRPLTNYPRYILSGGLNFRALIPGWSGGAVKALEAVARPVARYLALHHLIVIRRTSAPAADGTP